MKVIVPVKRVLDFNVKARVKADGSGVDLANAKMSMNPFDEIAVEEAVLVRDPLHRGRQRLQVVDVRRVREDRPGEGALLLAAFLVTHVEQVLQLGVGLEQPLVEAPNDRVTVFGQYGCRGLDRGDGRRRQHGC
jgi:hypothetical protein